MTKPKIKICCISSLEEALMAIEAGASAIGLVSEMPSGPGVISEEQISVISAALPDEINTFLLTSKQDSDSIIKQLNKCKTNTVQIVDRLLHGNYADIRNALPKVKIVQVVHVQDSNSVDEAVKISKNVDAILLDSGNQNIKVKELGGTGKTHDWTISKQIVESINIPVYLAGGLNSENVVEAVKTVKPYGVDLCSSVRTNDKLDKQKLTDFVETLNSV